MWRVGTNVPINVYDGERPVCQCHTVVDARSIVAAVNHDASHRAHIKELTDALAAEQERRANMTRLFDESDKAVKEKDALITELQTLNLKNCGLLQEYCAEIEALRARVKGPKS